jgi:hypothetical protein
VDRIKTSEIGRAKRRRLLEDGAIHGKKVDASEWQVGILNGGLIHASTRTKKSNGGQMTTDLRDIRPQGYPHCQGRASASSKIKVTKAEVSK